MADPSSSSGGGLLRRGPAKRVIRYFDARFQDLHDHLDQRLDHLDRKLDEVVAEQQRLRETADRLDRLVDELRGQFQRMGGDLTATVEIIIAVQRFVDVFREQVERVLERFDDATPDAFASSGARVGHEQSS